MSVQCILRSSFFCCLLARCGGMSAAARNAAIRMVLAPAVGIPAWKFGVRLYPDLSPEKCYRRIMLLIHPDKNGNSAESLEATKQLSSLWDDFWSWTAAYRRVSVTLERMGRMNGFEKDLHDALQKARAGVRLFFFNIGDLRGCCSIRRTPRRPGADTRPDLANELSWSFFILRVLEASAGTGTAGPSTTNEAGILEWRLLRSVCVAARGFGLCWERGWWSEHAEPGSGSRSGDCSVCVLPPRGFFRRVLGLFVAARGFELWCERDWWSEQPGPAVLSLIRAVIGTLAGWQHGAASREGRAEARTGSAEEERASGSGGERCSGSQREAQEG